MSARKKGPVASVGAEPGEDKRQTQDTTSQRFVKLDFAVLGRRNLTHSAKLIYAVIADRARWNGGDGPGVRRIAAAIGSDPKVVLRAIGQLQRVGLIEADSKGPGRRNSYRLKSVGESPALANHQRSRNASASVGESPAQALAERQHVQSRSELPQTEKKGRAGQRKASDWAAAREAMTGDTLDTAAFRVQWESWAKYRRERRQPLTASTAERQIRRLEALGHDTAIAAIEQSITNGWQGIFDPRRSAEAGRGDGGTEARRAEQRAKECPNDPICPRQL